MDFKTSLPKVENYIMNSKLVTSTIPSGIAKFPFPNMQNKPKTKFFCIPSRFATVYDFRRKKLLETTNYFTRVPNSKLFVFCPQDEHDGYKRIIINKKVQIIPYEIEFDEPKDYNIGDARNVILSFIKQLKKNTEVKTVCIVDDDITKLQTYPDKNELDIQDTNFWNDLEDDIINNGYILYSFVNNSSVRRVIVPEKDKITNSFFEADKLFPSGMVFLNLNLWIKHEVYYPPTRYFEDIVFSYNCSKFGKVIVSRRVIKTHGNSTSAKSTTRNKDNKDLSTYTEYDKKLHLEMIEDALKQGIICFGESGTTLYIKFYQDLPDKRFINIKSSGYTYFISIVKALIDDESVKDYENVKNKTQFFKSL